ncbi:MAG: hypothetical protein NWE94_03815 [Candidatus Bathyarchaeota archaeon]|nr:hypothetical protein [Candidatus Bathyarchaeota archaeon]
MVVLTPPAVHGTDWNGWVGYPGPDSYSRCTHVGTFNTSGDTFTALSIIGWYGTLPPAYVRGNWTFLRGYGGGGGGLYPTDSPMFCTWCYGSYSFIYYDYNVPVWGPGYTVNPVWAYYQTWIKYLSYFSPARQPSLQGSAASYFINPANGSRWYVSSIIPPSLMTAGYPRKSSSVQTPQSSILLSVQSVQLLEYKPQFNVDVAYAFVGKGSSEEPHSHFGWDINYPESQYPSAVYLNVTRASNAETKLYDALLEVFLIELISDKGPVESYAYFEGTNFTPSFSDAALASLTAHIYDLIDLNAVSGVSGHFRFNWTDSTSVLSRHVGSLGAYSNKPSGLGLWRSGEPGMVSVNIRRIGCVTMNGSSISSRVNVASANVALKLEKIGDGFLYNKMVPTDKLLQTDLFHLHT